MIVVISESQKKVLTDNIIGERVMVYYNLHKHTFSVQKSGLVLLHVDYIKLKDVEFRVRPGGREKVNLEKRKNVHAFVIGNVVDFCEFPCDTLPEETDGKVITYNPYVNKSFVVKETGEPIFNAEEINMINRKSKIFLIK
jgi:hypothetical protein